MSHHHRAVPQRFSTSLIIRLHIAALFLLAVGLPAAAQSDWANGATGVVWVNDKVGIGTSTPEANLHVFSSGALRGFSLDQYSNDTGGTIFYLRKSRSTTVAGNSAAMLQNGDGIATIQGWGADGSATGWGSWARMRFFIDGTTSAGVMPTAFSIYTGSTSTNERFRIGSNGWIGIGTSAGPTVTPATLFANTSTLYGDSRGSNNVVADGLSWAVSGSGYGAAVVNNAATTYSNVLLLKSGGTDASSRLLSAEAAGVTKFVVQADGSVGVNVLPSAGSLLDVGGNSSGLVKSRIINSSSSSSAYTVFHLLNDVSTIGSIFLNSSTNVTYGGVKSFNVMNSAGAPLTLGTNDTVRIFISAAGNVGVGPLAATTGNVVHALSVYGTPTVNGTAREVLSVNDTSAFAAGVGGGIVFGGKFNSTGTYAQEFASIQGVKENATDGNYASALVFNTRLNGGNPTERVRVTSQGRLGIGTANPASALDVNGDTNVTGNITVTGNINAKFQDVAEWVPALSELAAGTVVVLDHEHTNTVIASSHAYDTGVAGVVSAQPGITLGQAGSDKAKIATTGRVKVHVDASAHSIAIGDLLVTSSKPGTAMYSTPIEIQGRTFHQPGTVIGKALEPLASGAGDILVLLSLQ